MSTVTVPNTQADDVQAKLSWKIPVTLTIASLIILFFAITVEGNTVLRLNDRNQKIDIPDLTVTASTYLWIFFVIAAALTAWYYVSTVARDRFGKFGSVLDKVAIIGVAFFTILGFLIFAGAGSIGAVTLTSVLIAAIAISTPLIFGSLAGVVCERVGVVNIAIEGQLLIGAFAGVMASSFFKFSYAGLIAAPLAGAFIGCLLALFSVKYAVDQIIVGVVLNVLCLGLTTFFFGTLMTDNQALLNTNKYSMPSIKIPLLSEIPVIGPALFNQTILVYIMYIVVAVLTVYLFRSRWGLRLRAVGEHPKAADTVGINVNRTRIRNTILGSALAGLGGAYFTIGSGLAFGSNISDGNGYIALAAMILGKWHPIGAVGAALMFGFAQAVAQLIPNLSGGIPSELVNMIPYVITIIAVAGFVGKSRAPAAENIPYIK